MKTPDDLIGPAEAASRLGVCRRTVYRWMRTGLVARYRRAGRVFVSLADALSLTKEEPVPAGTEALPLVSARAASRRHERSMAGLRAMGFDV